MIGRTITGAGMWLLGTSLMWTGAAGDDRLVFASAVVLLFGAGWVVGA